MKPEHDKSAKTLEESAGNWVLRQNSGAWSAREQRQLDAWLAISEERRLAYAQALKLWQDLDRFKTVSFPARAAAYRRRAQRNRWTLLPGPALAAIGAAAFALLLAAGIGNSLSVSSASYRTAKGERLSLTLADGSQLDINTDTELQIRLSQDSRHINLVHGEAYFNVTHDASKPFEVTAIGGRIRDVGTRFNVYAEAERIQVAVTEGEVDVITSKAGFVSRWLGKISGGGWKLWAAQTLRSLGAENNPTLRLVAGEQTSYNGLGELSTVKRTEAERVTAWRKGRINFEFAPLDEVTHQLSRYHPVDFQFADPNLKQLKVTGNFEAANLPLVLNTLQSALPVTVERTDPQHVLILPIRR